MRKISLDQLTVRGTTPAEMVSIAAELGYDAVGPIVYDAKEFDIPVHPLFKDSPLTRETAALMKDTGVVFNNVDGFALLPNTRVADFREALELSANLGANNVVTLFLDTDFSRAFDNFCQLGEVTRDVGLGIALEFTPLSQIPSLDDALSVLGKAAQDNARILIDVLHLMKSGGSPEDIRRLGPNLIASAQICDGAVNPTDEQYLHACLYERQIPGQGELPLVEFIAALPPELVIGIEVPHKSLTDQGVPPKERARRVLAATQQLILEAEQAIG